MKSNEERKPKTIFETNEYALRNWRPMKLEFKPSFFARAWTRLHPFIVGAACSIAVCSIFVLLALTYLHEDAVEHGFAEEDPNFDRAFFLAIGVAVVVLAGVLWRGRRERLWRERRERPRCLNPIDFGLVEVAREDGFKDAGDRLPHELTIEDDVERDDVDRDDDSRD